MILGIILLIIIVILFIHIRIKFKIEFINSKLHLYIYNFEIPFNKKINTNDEIHKKQQSIKNEKKASFKKKSSKIKKIISKFKLKPLKLLDELMCNKFKPKLTIKNSMKYSLEDAALTAELFGGVNFFLYFVSSIINLFIKLIPNYNIEPTFSNETYLDVKVEGILSVSLAQIIFILFLLLKCLEIKGGNPSGESYGK